MLQYCDALFGGFLSVFWDGKMGRSKVFCFLALISVLISGCSLLSPFDCIEGQERCTKDGDGFLYEYCSANHTWEYHTCNICEGNTCKDFDDCGSDFQPTCQNNENGIGFIESCVNHKVMPASVCPYSAPCKDEHSCGIGIDVGDGCKNDDTLCVSIQGEHHLGTCKDNRWVMSDCPEGLVCIKGKTCGEEVDDEDVVEVCDTENAVTCKNVTERKETYGMLHICRDGVWRKDKVCPGRLMCDGEFCEDPDPCLEPKVLCGDNLCIDPKSDVRFCGARGKCKGESAGKACIEGQKCDNGTCVCEDNNKHVCIDLDGELACVEDKTSDVQCGCNETSPGMNCSLLDNTFVSRCVDGVCQYESCIDGYGDCDGDIANGCEVNIKNNETGLNCGGCGDEFKCEIPNMKSAACVDGRCEFECDEGYTKCNNQCVKLDENIKHCGFCGNACDESQEVCTNGFCTLKNTCDDGHRYVEVKVTLRDGTVNNVNAYCVDSYSTLKFIAEKYSLASEPGNEIPEGNTDKAYILTNDIVLENDFPSIGNSANPFDGIFLGNGKTITAAEPVVYMNDIAGIFGNSDGAIIDGFNVDYEGYVPVNKTVVRISLLVGYAKNTVIRRSVAHSSLLSAKYEAGILVGRAENSLIQHTRPLG